MVIILLYKFTFLLINLIFDIVTSAHVYNEGLGYFYTGILEHMYMYIMRGISILAYWGTSFPVLCTGNYF